MERFCFLVLFSFLLIFTAACGSVPNLEPKECIDSRQTVKSLYSNHFGSEMKPSPDKLKSLEKYLSKELSKAVSASLETSTDYFTQTEDYPKAFRIGGCEVFADDRTAFDVLLFWKDEERSEERKIRVETKKENGTWLINKIEKQ